MSAAECAADGLWFSGGAGISRSLRNIYWGFLRYVSMGGRTLFLFYPNFVLGDSIFFDSTILLQWYVFWCAVARCG